MFSTTNETIASLLEEVRSQFRDTGELADDELDAELIQRAIRLAEVRRTRLRVAQAALVAYVARNELYKQHRNRYPTLMEFLKDAGLGASSVSDLNAVGAILVPFCDKHEIEFDPYLSDSLWPKSREALPVLRRKAKAGDMLGFERILTDIRQLSGRNAVRAKYRRQRPKMGRGITIRTAENQLILVAVLDNGEEDELVSRISPVLNMNERHNNLKDELVDILSAALQAVVNGGTDAG